MTITNQRVASAATIACRFMYGRRPLSYLINDRAAFLRDNDPRFRLANTIRQVIADVKEMARFQGLLYLACYTDVLNPPFDEICDAS